MSLQLNSDPFFYASQHNTSTGTVMRELPEEKKVIAVSGTRKARASFLPKAPLGLVKFDLMAFPVN